MIKATFFDLFGVIHTDTLDAWLASKGIVRAGNIADITKQGDMGILTTAEFFEALAVEAGSTADQIRAEFREFEVIDAEVIEIIKRLGKSYTVSLITNSSADYVREELKRFELEPLFDHIVVSAELGAVKPQSKIFLESLRLADVDPSEAVFIDDRPVNVEGAKRVGLNTIVFTSAAQLEAELKQLGVSS